MLNPDLRPANQPAPWGSYLRHPVTIDAPSQWAFRPSAPAMIWSACGCSSRTPNLTASPWPCCVSIRVVGLVRSCAVWRCWAWSQPACPRRISGPIMSNPSSKSIAPSVTAPPDPRVDWIFRPFRTPCAGEIAEPGLSRAVRRKAVCICCSSREPIRTCRRRSSCRRSKSP